MSRDELGHLEHVDLALAVKYRLERIVRVNLSSLFFVLKTVLLDVGPKLLGELGTGKRCRTDNSREFIVGLNRFHEGGVRLAF